MKDVKKPNINNKLPNHGKKNSKDSKKSPKGTKDKKTAKNNRDIEHGGHNGEEILPGVAMEVAGRAIGNYPGFAEPILGSTPAGDSATPFERRDNQDHTIVVEAVAIEDEEIEEVVDAVSVEDIVKQEQRKYRRRLLIIVLASALIISVAVVAVVQPWNKGQEGTCGLTREPAPILCDNPSSSSGYCVGYFCDCDDQAQFYIHPSCQVPSDSKHLDRTHPCASKDSSSSSTDENQCETKNRPYNQAYCDAFESGIMSTPFCDFVPQNLYRKLRNSTANIGPGNISNNTIVGQGNNNLNNTNIGPG
jgi:predicted nucleic acid-binding Zn ribbon protein